MNENVKLDVAIEIMSTKLANAMNKNDKEETIRLLQEREEMYRGNWDIINKVLNEYSNDVKRK